jgi:hypothetical protein
MMSALPPNVLQKPDVTVPIENVLVAVAIPCSTVEIQSDRGQHM